jgi:large subunit ribosomal protein L10
MERLGQLLRKQMVKELLSQLHSSPAFFAVRTTGLTAQDMEELRRVLKSASSRCSIVKNTISKLALKEFQLDGLMNLIDGPTTFVFSSSDPIVTSKVLINFSKEHGALKINGGYLEGRIILPEIVRQLASLPPREILLARIAYGIKSPLLSLATVLSGTLRKFVCVLEEIGRQKEIS